jgi:hypothetical protein
MKITKRELKSMIRTLVQESISVIEIGDMYQTNGSIGFIGKDGMPELENTLVEYKGHHPNIHQITDVLRVTAVDGDIITLNKKYTTTKDFLSKYTNEKDKNARSTERYAAEVKRESEKASKFKVGDKVIIQDDIYVGVESGSGIRKVKTFGQGNPRIKKGAKKTIKEVSYAGIFVTGLKSTAIPTEYLKKA